VSTLNPARARKELGFHPAFSLEDGLSETVAWYLSRTKGRVKGTRGKEERGQAKCKRFEERGAKKRNTTPGKRRDEAENTWHGYRDALSGACIVCLPARDRLGRILIDIGPSVVRRLMEYGYTTNNVDMIVLTHFHPDHTVDLATFLFASNYGDVTREKPLVLLGGKGLDTFFRNMCVCIDGLPRLDTS